MTVAVLPVSAQIRAGLINLATMVTGTLPVANGGTGATTLTGVLKGNGTSAFTAATPGTDYLRYADLATPTDATYTLGNATHRLLESFLERVTMTTGASPQTDIYVNGAGNFEIDAGADMFLYSPSDLTVNADGDLLLTGATTSLENVASLKTSATGYIAGIGSSSVLFLKPAYDLDSFLGLYSFIHAGDTDRNVIHTQQYARTDHVTNNFESGAYFGASNTGATTQDIFGIGAEGHWTAGGVLSDYEFYLWDSVNSRAFFTINSLFPNAMQFGPGISVTVPAVVTGGNFNVATGGALRTDTTTAHTALIQAYDVDGTAYKTFATLTNGNTPNFALSAPSGGTLSGDFSTLAVGGVAVATASSSTAFTNKTGNISQWTNDSSYLTSVTAHNLLSTTHGDALADAVVRGDLLYGNATPKWARLAKPSVLSGLSHDGTDVSWVTATGTGAPVRAAGATLSTPTLGVAVATSLNGNTFTTGTYTLTGVAGKTLTFNNSITLAGTDSTTMTFPTTSATIARTDAANTFTGVQTMTSPTLTTPTIASMVSGGQTITVPAAAGSLPIIIASGGTATSTTNSVTEVNLKVVTIPAGTMGANGRLRIETWWKFVGTAGTKTPRIRFSATSGDTSGGLLVQDAATVSASLVQRGFNEILNTNNAAAQLSWPVALGPNYGNGANAWTTAAINTANASYINFNALVANTGDTAQLVGYTVTFYPGQ